MNNKQVSFKVDADVYKVLKRYATLDDRSVRSWFERYIKATFKADYNAVLSSHQPALNADITDIKIALDDDWDNN